MASRAASKPARSTAKTTVKTPGKDQGKGDKQPANILEIVPGKFNENDWLLLLENEDTEDFIADIFDSIWIDTAKQIHEAYIRRQLLPFTLMMTENALSSVIQWAFLEKDEPQPANGDFWAGDDEPTPCSMDNWGEGVVPACREERPQSIEESPTEAAEGPSGVNINIDASQQFDLAKRPSRISSVNSSIPSKNQTKQRSRTESTHQEIKNQQYVNGSIDDEILSQKESSSGQNPSRATLGKKSYNHDVLVISNRPTKLEPLSNLFYSVQVQVNDSSKSITPATTFSKPRRLIAPKASSMLGSDAFASTTNVTATTTTKSLRKAESKVFVDQHIEDVISKAPAAAHSMLKSILNRPPGYRELELDDYGNVISMVRLDPDKFAPRSIQVKCDIVKPRKAVIETHPLPKKPPQMKPSQSEPKFSPVKLVLPEHSSEVGDLIQPVPGVLYEDSRLKKGDPRRYKNGLSKYTNFYDETRPLKPIARQSNIALIQAANDFLRLSQDYNDDYDNEYNPQIPKLHRLARIPPIMSGSSSSSS